MALSTQQLVTLGTSFLCLWKSLLHWALSVRINGHFLADTDNKKVSLYCGIPFCDTRCVYCSFPYGLYQDYDGKRQFLTALCRDIEDMKTIVESYGLTVDTLYMGGGTPTVLGDEDFHQVLKQLSILVPEGHEFTVEAGRPDSVNPVKLRSMLELGVNRISINPQTMQDDILRRIGRGHSARDIDETVTICKSKYISSGKYGFYCRLTTSNDAKHGREYGLCMSKFAGKCYNSYVSIKTW